MLRLWDYKKLQLYLKQNFYAGNELDSYILS